MINDGMGVFVKTNELDMKFLRESEACLLQEELI